MNTYFLRLLSSCKTERRESIRNLRLPNGKEEGRKDTNQRINVWRRSRLLFSYTSQCWDHAHVDFNLQLRLNNSVIFGVEVSENVFNLSFNLDGFPNRIRYYTNIYFQSGFQ